MLSLMWSEHCAYKHSRKLLRRLPTEGPHVLMGPGENAGVVDVGDGLAVAFKVESHNHPSAVEPFQGAATGVGGILRDVFAVGARPIAVLDSLRFGEPAVSERSRYLLEHAVAGIGHYGNSIGVPTVGGEIYFEQSYEQNCLVNAMCLGLAPHERLIRSAAAGVGNVLVLLGALTGRDGIGGASVLASAELGEGDEAKRPSVQIGDPFAEKKLLECCLELLDRELLVSLQDLGAAGLTSSASEMASKGDVGLDIDVSRVPLRETGMEAFEIMVSESQERMLCVVEPERVADVLDVCERWEVLATPIGSVNADGVFRVLDRGRRRRRPAGRGARRRLSALRPRARGARARRLRRAAGDAARRRAGARDAAGAAALGEHRLAPARVRAVRPDRAVADRPPSRRGRRRRAGAARTAVAIAVSIDGNGRRVACDPARRRGRGGVRVLGEPRLRRRRAARADQLPELRQPREAARRLAAAASGRRARRGVRGARRAGRRRQRLALQRGADRSDLPHSGRRHGRAPARRGAGRTARVRAGGRRDRARRRRSRRRSPAPSWRSCAARRRSARSRRSSRRSSARPTQARARGRPLGRAAQRPRHRRGRPRGRARRVLHRRRDRRDGDRSPTTSHLFGEAPGRAFVVSGRAEELDRLPDDRSCRRHGARDRAAN